jgi:hypothetical protein
MSQVEHENRFPPRLLGVDAAGRSISPQVEHDHHFAASYVLEEEHLGETGFADA